MTYLIIILVIIIIGLLIYLFLFNLEIKRIKKEIDLIMHSKTNILIHSAFSSKNLKSLIQDINKYLQEIKTKESIIEHKNNNLLIMMRNISHDLRTPLTAAAGYIDLILNSAISEEEKIKELEIIQSRLKKLNELVNAFFEFSKILTTNDIKLENLNIVSIIEESIANFYTEFEKTNRLIDFKTPKNKINISSNKIMLSRIFDNLIANALKHGTGNLQIVLEIKKTIKITFINELLDSNLDTTKIFDEFYTTDISRTKGSTGLGLAIVKKFTEELNGQIKATKKDNMLYITLTFKQN